MHRPRKPRNLGLYRVAAIALFRALLKQTQAATALDLASRSSLSNVVRNRFRANASLISVRHTKVAYLAGYHGLDILDACVDGSGEATLKILDLLSRTPEGLKLPPPKYKSKETRKQERNLIEGHEASRLACPPTEHQLLSIYPRQVVRGKRKIPIFTAATAIPFLRIKKPQPANLSRVIRDKLAQRQARFLRLQVLENYYSPLSRWEDEWDRNLQRQRNIEHHTRPPLHEHDEGSWTEEVERQLRELRIVYDQANQERLRMAKKMWSIVEMETKLANSETSSIPASIENSRATST